MKFAFALFGVITVICSFGQTVKSDRDLLKDVVSVEDSDSKQIKKTSWNPAYILYQGSMGFYQKAISPQIGANCIYETTCSRFSRQLVGEYGVVKGFFLSLDRVGRCNKLSYLEASPTRINSFGKVREELQDYRLH